MPLTDEQQAALQALQTADPEDFATALRDTAQPQYQRIYNVGHSEATKRAKREKDELSEQLQTEREAKEALAAEATELREKQPDVKELNEQWQKKLATATEKHQQDLAAVQERAEAERQARKTSDLKAALTGLDPVYIGVVAERNASRIRYRDDGAAELLDAGGDIPVQTPAGKTPFEVLAEELKQQADPRWVLSNGDRGAGQSSGSAAANSYDAAKAGRDMAATQKANATDDSLAFR